MFRGLTSAVVEAGCSIVDDIDSDSHLVVHYLAHGARKLLKEFCAATLAGGV
jgi:hypothetical protein